MALERDLSGKSVLPLTELMPICVLLISFYT